MPEQSEQQMSRTPLSAVRGDGANARACTSRLEAAGGFSVRFRRGRTFIER